MESENKIQVISKITLVEAFFLLLTIISLPISMTLSWVFLCCGLVLCLTKYLLISPKSIFSDFNKIINAPLTLPILLFCLTVTVSGALNGIDSKGQHGFSAGLGESFRSFISLKSLFIYFWSYNIFRQFRTYAYLSFILLISVSAVAGLWGTIQQIFNIHPGYQYLQGTGFHGHPMAFAGQMQIFCMMSFGLLLVRLEKKEIETRLDKNIFAKIFSIAENKCLVLLIFLLNLAGLFFAGERSAWLGGGLALISMCFVKDFRFGLFGTAVTSVLAIFSYLFIPLFKTRINSMFSGNDLSLSVRTHIWQVCFKDYFLKEPLFGIGILRFPNFDIPEAIVPGVSKFLNHAHSNYIHILTTLGIIGEIAFLYLSASTIFVCLKQYVGSKSQICSTDSINNSNKGNMEEKFESVISLGLFGSFLSLSISGIFEYNFGTSQVRLAQWLLAGLLL